MTNNILKEVKNELINRGREPYVDNFDQYISQNKIFSIFFISKIIPELSSILNTMNSLYKNNEIIKLIICICSDSKEDFEETLLHIKEDISCLIFNYESKNKENFINKFNIITIPSMIVLDKEGTLIDSLNIQRIKCLNENDFKGWENISKQKLFRIKKPELGDVIKLDVHQHDLVFSDNDMKGYGGSGWICDICRTSYSASVLNFFCPICGWDICDVCYNKNKNN